MPRHTGPLFDFIVRGLMAAGGLDKKQAKKRAKKYLDSKLGDTYQTESTDPATALRVNRRRSIY